MLAHIGINRTLHDETLTEVSDLMNFPVCHLAFLSTVPGNPAFGAFLQIFRRGKAAPA